MYMLTPFLANLYAARRIGATIQGLAQIKLFLPMSKNGAFDTWIK
jgi:hypothetical protein